MGKLVRFRLRARPRPDARPARLPTDASPNVETPRPGTTPDPDIARKRRLRQRSVVIALTIVFLGGSAAALFGDRGYLDVRRQRAQYRQMRADYQAHLNRVQGMKREVDRLKSDPTAVERIAREELGYVAKDEITLLLPEDDPPGPPRLDAKVGSGIVSPVRSTP
ncbi:MAG TPA: septum formation initiator family protein [Candidatus Polarisedimenticolaceae bacterium]|nr:septum formation initiator family protein [Candidatus Polarisedimenticolaceae bacterium]